jgi:hypothetical protein
MSKLIDNTGWHGNWPDSVSSLAFGFCVNNKDGASVTYSGGTFSVYKDDNTTQFSSDIQIYAYQTGDYKALITTSDAFYVAGHDYTLVVTGTTVDSETVNAVIGSFSIDNRT